MKQAWEKVQALGLDVRVIRTTPWLPFEPAKCLATATNWIADCIPPRSTALRRDPVSRVATQLNVRMVDLSAYFCTDRVCPVMIGGALVYRDSHHITTTYARTLSEVMADALALPN
jgi:hypothetical protein